MSMPNMDGVETFLELMKIRDDVPVILMSGFSEHEAQEHFKEKLPSGFIQKPYRGSELLARIQETLSKSSGSLS